MLLQNRDGALPKTGYPSCFAGFTKRTPQRHKLCEFRAVKMGTSPIIDVLLSISYNQIIKSGIVGRGEMVW